MLSKIIKLFRKGFSSDDNAPFTTEDYTRAAFLMMKKNIYYPGTLIYFLLHHQVYEGHVIGYKISMIKDHGLDIQYIVYSEEYLGNIELEEDHVFTTKRELIQSLEKSIP